MDFKKFGNFNWIEIDSKDQNLDLTRTKRIHFCPFPNSEKKLNTSKLIGKCHSQWLQDQVANPAMERQLIYIIL